MQDLPSLSGLEVSAIVPAYNEAKNIIGVLLPLQKVASVKEIIVISDGSTDDTVELVSNLSGVKLIALPQNVGKTRAVMAGVHAAKYDTVLFCDADLLNLNESRLISLLEKYSEGFEMVIMDKGSQPWFFKHLLQSVPAVSGTRILAKRHFYKIPFKATDRFQFEIRINNYFLENGLRVAVTSGDEIHDPRKFVKYPFRRGLLLDIKGGLEVLASDGPLSVFKNLAMFRKIKKLTAITRMN